MLSCKKIWVTKILGPNNILVLLNFGPNKILALKKFWFSKIFKKFLVQQKMLGSKKIGSKILCPKKIWVPKYLRLKKMDMGRLGRVPNTF